MGLFKKIKKAVKSVTGGLEKGLGAIGAVAGTIGGLALGGMALEKPDIPQPPPTASLTPAPDPELKAKLEQQEKNAMLEKEMKLAFERAAERRQRISLSGIFGWGGKGW